MKAFYLLLITSLFSLHFLHAQNIHFPDPNFKSALISNGVDTNNDGEISQSEAENQTLLSLSNKSISDLTGIKYFKNVFILFCNGNSIEKLDLRDLEKLSILNCQDNDLTSLNLNGLTDLTLLQCDHNLLSTLSVNGLTNLQTLIANYNNLVSLDVRNTPNLQSIQVTDNCQLECIIIDNQTPLFRSYLLSVCIKLSNILTHTPCLTTFDGIAILIQGAGLPPLTEAVFNTTLRLAEESCLQGSKKKSISTLRSFILMVYRLEQIGRMSSVQADAFLESVHILIDDIHSGAVACNGEKKNLLDWINDWFGYSLENPSNVNNTITFDTESPVKQKVYPNPTTGRVNFSQPDQQVVVYNMLGKIITKAEGADHIDLSNYQPGVYVIQLSKGVKKTMHQVIKQ